mgnify:CR=1 FL=1
MKYIFLLCTLLAYCEIYSQATNTVVLKSGAMYRGSILSADTGRVVLLGYDFNTYVFDTAEIAKFTHTPKPRFPNERIQSGIMNDVSLALTYQRYISGVRLNYTLDRVFAYRHAIGAEISLYLNDEFLPTIGLRYRYEMLKRPSTPFVYVCAGNYTNILYSRGLGYRVNLGLGFQWGAQKQRRNYVIVDWAITALQYKEVDGLYLRKERMLSIGFGRRF